MTQGAEPPKVVRGLVSRNIRALIGARRELERSRGRDLAIADRVTAFTGRMPFVYLHVAGLSFWILANTGCLPFVHPFDPFPFVMLAMIAAVESIFLTTFVLISQNRQALIAERRADLDLQINLLAEHEITSVLHLVHAVARRVGVPPEETPNTEELRADVAPEQVLREIERVENEAPQEAGR